MANQCKKYNWLYCKVWVLDIPCDCKISLFFSSHWIFNLIAQRMSPAVTLEKAKKWRQPVIKGRCKKAIAKAVWKIVFFLPKGPKSAPREKKLLYRLSIEFLSTMNINFWQKIRRNISSSEFIFVPINQQNSLRRKNAKRIFSFKLCIYTPHDIFACIPTAAENITAGKSYNDLTMCFWSKRLKVIMLSFLSIRRVFFKSMCLSYCN